jgi:hypothetical protein
MSQVVVTDDNLKSRRIKSGEQERQIDRESGFDKWKLSDVTKFDPVAAVLGLVALPVVLSWYAIGLVVKIAVYIGIGISRLIGVLIGNNKAL